MVCEGQPEPMSGILQLLMFWLLLNKISWDTGSQVLHRLRPILKLWLIYMLTVSSSGPHSAAPCGSCCFCVGRIPPKKYLDLTMVGVVHLVRAAGRLTLAGLLCQRLNLSSSCCLSLPPRG